MDETLLVQDDGTFSRYAGPLFAGKQVLTDGTASVIDALKRTGHLLKEQVIKHKYPYDWRSKTPLITRATPQWFANVDAIKNDALVAIEDVQMIPTSSRTRLQSFVKSRSEWCISRQRAWGVPIPVFYFKDTGKPLINDEILLHIE